MYTKMFKLSINYDNSGNLVTTIFFTKFFLNVETILKKFNKISGSVRVINKHSVHLRPCTFRFWPGNK